MPEAIPISVATLCGVPALPLSSSVPDPESFADESARTAARKALEYMGLEAGTPIGDAA